MNQIFDVIKFSHLRKKLQQVLFNFLQFQKKGNMNVERSSNIVEESAEMLNSLGELFM